MHFSEYKEANLVSWINSEKEWNKLVKNTEICSGGNPMNVLLPWCLGMKEAKYLCDKYRGKMTMIRSSELQKELFSRLDGITNIECLSKERVYIWTGFSDEASEGKFISIIDGRPLNGINPFSPSQPNGDSEENCARAEKDYPFEVSWSDSFCDRPLVSFCGLKKNPMLQIRGIR